MAQRRPPAPACFAAACLTVVVASAGCTTPRGVPSGADLMTEATVKGSFQAPADGMLYIYRVPARGSKGQLHYSGPIAAGQVLVIDAAMNKATLDGRELELVLPSGDVWYQAYFRADPRVRKVLNSDRWPPPRSSTTTTSNTMRDAGSAPATSPSE